MTTPLRDLWEVPDDGILPAGWFHDLGVPVFPIASGTKEPATNGASWKGYRSTRAQATSWRAYGVPLGSASGLTVVDTDFAADETWVAAQLLDTPFKVRTGPYHDGSPGNGRQRYYRTNGPLPSTIHRDGLSIENRNEGLYVLGPGSVHPSGVIYTADDWSWDIRDVPFFPSDFVFNDGSCPQQVSVGGTGGPLVLPASILKQRHEAIHKIMRCLVAHGVPLDGAMKVCRIENKTKCSPPLTDKELNDAFLRRAYHQKDRADFVRSPQTGWELAGSLCAVGLSVEAVLVAVRSIDPTFDPETSE